MELAELRAHCLAKAGVEESYPFGPGTLVMKVAGKVFVIIGEDDEPLTVSLKCEPEIAIVLRERYPAVTPGYHLNKRHWNTVALDGSVPEHEVVDWIDDSFDLVVEGLPRRVRATIDGSR
ncbi:MAG: MmcQ/YjbR family DNA-binding protein [Actinomycetota bacterium]|nr:MmcQ/YjbR family DNA-binding protein [Actinomycetota bacterium]